MDILETLCQELQLSHQQLSRLLCCKFINHKGRKVTAHKVHKAWSLALCDLCANLGGLCGKKV